VGLFDRFRKGKGEQADSPPLAGAVPASGEGAPQPRDPVRIVDAQGNAFLIEKEVYAALVPEHLEKAWNEPRALQGVIASFLRDGLFQEVLPGARRLLEIAQGEGREDAQLLLAHVLNQLGESDESRAIIEAVIAEAGVNAHRLANLARVSYAQERMDEFRAQLQQCLELDANRSDALQMWLADLQQQGGGEHAGVQLLEYAERTNSWRAWLIVAESLLGQEEADRALAILANKIDYSQVTDTGMAQSSAYICQAGHFDMAVQLLSPHFDVSEHGYEAGLNLAQAHLALKQNDAALKLMDQVESLGVPGIAKHLAELRERAAAQ